MTKDDSKLSSCLKDDVGPKYVCHVRSGTIYGTSASTKILGCIAAARSSIIRTSAEVCVCSSQ